MYVLSFIMMSLNPWKGTIKKQGEQEEMEWRAIASYFYNPKDTEKLEKFLKDKPVAEREIGTQLISEMAFFAESSQCRRKSLLHYFGENFDEDNCNKMCDNCRNPRETIDATNSLSTGT